MAYDEMNPAPTAANSERQGGDGNTPVTGEKHDQKKAERAAAGSRFTLRAGGERQPERMAGDGNTPVTGEKHDQKKAEYVKPA